MEVIYVPPPAKEAFHKGRPMSDLIKAQVAHFKHVEAKLSAEEQKSIPQHRITTENEAAIYIAAMTRLLRAGVNEKQTKPRAISITSKKPAARPAKGLAIAASADRPAKLRRKTKSKSSSKKK